MQGFISDHYLLNLKSNSLIPSQKCAGIFSFYYIHNDHLGTPQVVTNQTKQVVWMADYQPFGKVNLVTNTVELYSRFPGQYVDGETGNYYNYFRDYDPSIGRYIESDPIGLEGGINTYGYGFQNSLRYTDPLGLVPNPLEGACLAGPNPFCGAGVAADAITSLAALGTALWMETSEKPKKKTLEEWTLNQAKNKACKSPDPKTGDACADAKVKLSRLQQCLNLRIEYRDKYGDAHPEEITNTTAAVAKAEAAVKEACKDDCTK